MADGQRAAVVDVLGVHHTAVAGEFFIGWSDIDIQDWFDQVGKARGYDPAGVTRSYHQHPSRDKDTFAMYHLCLVPDGDPYSEATNWRIVPLMRDIWNNVAWSLGNWPYNQRAINIVVGGDWRGHQLPKKALYEIARFWQPHDAALAGATSVVAHKWVSPTICPADIEYQIEPDLVRYINDLPAAKLEVYPAPKWNGKLHPVSMLFEMSKGIPLFDLLTGKEVTGSGSVIHITQRTDVAAVTINGVGHTMYLPVDRVAANQMMGFREVDLYKNLKNKYEPAFTYKVLVDAIVLYKGTDKKAAQKQFDTHVPATDATIKLVENATVLAERQYTKPAPPPEPEFIVTAGTAEVFEVIHVGHTAEAAQVVYNNTKPTADAPIVRFTKDGQLITQKQYQAPAEPQPEPEPEQPQPTPEQPEPTEPTTPPTVGDSLFDLVAGWVKTIISFLKQYKRST